jgi:hypothetical protein
MISFSWPTNPGTASKGDAVSLTSGGDGVVTGDAVGDGDGIWGVFAGGWLWTGDGSGVGAVRTSTGTLAGVGRRRRISHVRPATNPTSSRKTTMKRPRADFTISSIGLAQFPGAIVVGVPYLQKTSSHLRVDGDAMLAADRYTLQTAPVEPELHQRLFRL